MAKIFSAADIIADSVNKNLETLFDAWRKELDEAAKALRKQAKKNEEQKGVEAAKTRRRAFAAAEDAAQNASLLYYVTGALNSAEANDSIAITIPAGVQVASTHLSGPTMSVLADLISDLSDEMAVAGEDEPKNSLTQHQQSMAWALAHGYVPHGNDLAAVIDAAEPDHPWSQRFAQLAREHSAVLPEAQGAPARLRGHIAHRELTGLYEQVQNLKAFGVENLGRLITARDSASVKTALHSVLPNRGPSNAKTKLPSTQFNQMLDGLFSKKNS